MHARCHRPAACRDDKRVLCRGDTRVLCRGNSSSHRMPVIIVRSRYWRREGGTSDMDITIIYAHTYIHTYAHTYIHTHIHITIICEHITIKCENTYIHTHINAYIHVYSMWQGKSILNHLAEEGEGRVGHGVELALPWGLLLPGGKGGGSGRVGLSFRCHRNGRGGGRGGGAPQGPPCGG